MAKGPFGNPLSTGIALSGVIDMVTPVRQAQERKRKRQAEEKAAGDKRAKELGAIMGKITIDEDKIWWRYHDDARSQYANTIDKVQQMYSAGDYAGMYKTINDFDSRMANYTQATTLKNKRREELAKGKYYMDSNLENMAESRDVDNEEYGKLLAESGYGAYGEDRMFSYMPNAEIYDIKDAWEKELKGDEKVFIKEGEKAVTEVGKTPSGIIVTKDYNPSVITRAQQKIRSDIYRDPYRAARILEKNGYDVSSLESITDPTQRTEKTLEMFDDYIMKNRPGVDQQVLNVRAAKENKGWTFGGGGAKSPNWEVNKVSNIPVSLTDEVGGSLSGWKVDYIKQSGVSEIERNIELGKGSYFAEGGSKIQKVSDAASGLGKIIKGTPAGVYVRDDKKGGQLWVAYETNYIPPTDKLMEGFGRYYDPNKKDNNGNTITKEEQKQAFMATRMSEDKDLVSKTTKRVVYVPIKSDSEKIEFRTTMGMSSDEFNKLTDMIGFSSKSGTSSITARQKSALDAFANQNRRQPTASERQQILKKYQ